MGFSELLNMCLPVAIYWIASGIYHLLLSSNKENSRLFSKEEEDTKNLASRRQVLVGVLVNQSMQMAAFGATMKLGGDGGAAGGAPPTSWLRLAGQLAAATLIMDAWGYFWHRLTHESEFLMRHVHDMHHRLIVPYAYGTQYVHPVDSLFGEFAAGVVAATLVGMSEAAVYFSALTLKAVDDHCGLWFPGGNPIHRFCQNSTAFHAVHHQRVGFKHNYSAHFLQTWDLLLGTYLPFVVEKEREEGGGYHIRTAKED